MKAPLINSVKNIKKLGSLYQKTKATAAFLSRFSKRNSAFIFHTSKLTLASAVRTEASNETHAIVNQIEDGNMPDLFIYRNVVCYPMRHGQVKKHSGGLIDGTSKQLIEKAVHFNGDYCQELPDANVETFAVSRHPEISQLVLYGGIIYNHFGHFLLESLGRLWAYNYVRNVDPFILFQAYGSEPPYLEKENYIHQVLNGFQIPIKKIILTPDVLKLNQVIVPAQKYGYELCKKPDAVFVDFIRTFKFPLTIPPVFRDKVKIYVSRSKLPAGGGRMVGEIFFEKYLESEGYHIFYPEKHPLYEQLSVYGQAEKLIFADGGAIHACILLPDLAADVAVIARRRDPRWSTEDILDQFTGYGKAVFWIDHIKEQYQFGLETWEAIAAIDWFSVSESLKIHGFVSVVFDGFAEMDYSEEVKKELRAYIGNINTNERFIDFMMNLDEKDIGVTLKTHVKE